MLRHFLLATVTGMLAAPAQQPIPLHNGQNVTLHGTLTMQPSGRLQFVTVRTQETYVPLVQTEHGGAETSAEPTAEVSLAGYHSYRFMYAHRGQNVVVTGKMLTDDVTPYFFHATRLELQTMALSDGTKVLLPRATTRRVLPAVRGYRAKVILLADLAKPWRYSVGHKQDVSGQYLSCDSNGGGDVVNCFCTNGFHPVHSHSSSGVDGRIFADMQMAQFGVGDDARRVELSVTCSR